MLSLETVCKMLIEARIWSTRLAPRFSLILPIPSGETGGRALVMGNGPSLPGDLKGLRLENFSSVVGVNFFPATPYFTRVKPNAIFLQDDYWFYDEESRPGKAQDTWRALKAADWRVDLFVPRNRLSVARSQLGSETNIRVVESAVRSLPSIPRHVLPFLRRRQTRLLVDSWSRLALVPAATNVVSSALFQAIFSGFEEIVMAGVDMNLTKGLYAASAGGVAMHIDYFYGAGVPPPKSIAPGNLFSDTLFEIGHKFKTFELLALLAEKRKVQVKVATPNSTLTSFPRYG